MSSRVKDAMKFLAKGLAISAGALFIHTTIHEWLHWIPAKLLGLNPSSITLEPFVGGSIWFQHIFPEAVLALLLPLWVLGAIGTYLLVSGFKKYSLTRVAVGGEFLSHELIYQFCWSTSDLNILYGDWKIIGILILLELMGIGIIIAGKADKTEGRPSLLCGAMQSLRSIRLPAFLSERRKPKNHR